MDSVRVPWTMRSPPASIESAASVSALPIVTVVVEAQQATSPGTGRALSVVSPSTAQLLTSDQSPVVAVYSS